MVGNYISWKLVIQFCAQTGSLVTAHPVFIIFIGINHQSRYRQTKSLVNSILTNIHSSTIIFLFVALHFYMRQHESIKTVKHGHFDQFIAAPLYFGSFGVDFG